MKCLNCEEGAIFRCSECKYAHYCSNECQTLDWTIQHKEMCCLLKGSMQIEGRGERIGRGHIYDDFEYRDAAVSWVIHALRIFVGFEDVRRLIIQTKFETVKNIDQHRAFDADDMRIINGRQVKKEDEIEDYIKSILEFQPYVVFSASNIVPTFDGDEDEVLQTHFVGFFVDNENQRVIAIDPASRGGRPGIYTPVIARDVVFPIFKKEGYDTHYARYTSTVQSEYRDVFCQTWSLHLLIELLKLNELGDYGEKDKISVPKQPARRYALLLNFYKEILRDISGSKDLLNMTYEDELESYKKSIIEDEGVEFFEAIKKVKASSLLKEMTVIDMV